jgi:serine/threonine protein kinase
MPESTLPWVHGPSGPSVRVEPGTRVGSYEVLHCIGRGGMANVWVAKHHGVRGFTKLVALKTILPEFAVDPEFEQMLLEEARLAGMMRHPNVCEVFELIELQGLLALSMEWVDGESLSRMLAASTERLDRRITAWIVAEAAAGVHAAHESRDEAGRSLRLVHRDVSPQNILISRDGHVKLSDFGIAKALENKGEATAVGRVKGKLGYMSPEQARNGELDRRSDVFSLGVVLYYCVLGKRPFSQPKESAEEALARLLDADYVRPRELDPSCPEELAAIIERALQRDPALRYQSAGELRRDLELWLFTSGALTTEHDVARVLNERCGAALDRRATAMRAALDSQTRMPAFVPPRVSQESSSSAASAPPDTAVATPLRPKFAASPQKLAVLGLLLVVLLVASSSLVVAANTGLLEFSRVPPSSAPAPAVQATARSNRTENVLSAAPVERNVMVTDSERSAVPAPAVSAASSAEVNGSSAGVPTADGSGRARAPKAKPRVEKLVGPVERDL